jgi:hypothetical protein
VGTVFGRPVLEDVTARLLANLPGASSGRSRRAASRCRARIQALRHPVG